MEFKLAWQFSLFSFNLVTQMSCSKKFLPQFEIPMIVCFCLIQSIQFLIYIFVHLFFIYQTLFSDQKRDSKPLSHCCNTNSISASASVAPAALLENHHYRRGVFQFFFRNQTISTLSRTENRPHSEIVGDKRWSGPAEHFKFRWGHKPIWWGKLSSGRRCHFRPSVYIFAIYEGVSALALNQKTWTDAILH